MTSTVETPKTQNTAPPPSPAKRIMDLLGNQQLILFLVLAAMIIFFSARNSIFFSTGVFGNILLDWGPVVLIAVGETFVVISGGIDLSVGSTAGVSGVLAAFVMRDMTTAHNGQAMTLLVGGVIAAAVGAGVGLINAMLINFGRIVPFVATLATFGAAAGISNVLTGGAPIGGGPPNTILLVVPKIGPVSYPVLGVAVIVVIAALFLHTARFGRYTYAIGSNPFAARAAGINVKVHLTKVYALSGMLAGLAGMFFYLRLGSGAPTTGKGGELLAIAAVVIGGAALSGGIGRMSGTVLGALILTTVTSGLIIIGVNPDWNQVVVAGLIATAALAQSLRRTNRTI